MKQQRRLIKLMFLFGGLCVSLWQGAPYVDALLSAHEQGAKAGLGGPGNGATGNANLAALQALTALHAGAAPQSPAGVSHQASSLLAQLGLASAGADAEATAPTIEPITDDELVLFAADGRRLSAEEAAALRAAALRNRPKLKAHPGGPGAANAPKPKGPPEVNRTKE